MAPHESGGRPLLFSVHWFWQTYAWSGGLVEPRAHVLQFSNSHNVAGVDCDYNHSLKEDFGQWGFQAPAPPKPHPDPYAIYPTGPFAYQGHQLKERQIVQLYDKYRAQQTWTKHPHRQDLAQLREYCNFLAKRVAYLAHQKYPKLPVAKALAIGPNHWGVRFQLLSARAQGKRVR